ncbi:MAG: SMP-30/gluconolactonase/LRE family protein [Proteobacteria bacterium]|nr:SMP-30/gluconolactonase/LRE family protein [Pseudomonadota bacterium]
MAQIREITSGLQFPEGPVAMDDGSVLVVEIKRGTLTRVKPDGKQQIIANVGGGPNGAAIGPDGACYICNDGGFEWMEMDGMTVPGHTPHSYTRGSIQRVDLNTGKVEVLYTQCDGHALKGPNDIVFDKHGGMWFTDFGKTYDRSRDRTGIFYAKTDGSFIKEVVFPMDGPNGIGLGPNDKMLYVAETFTARVWQWEVSGPGELKRVAGVGGPLLEGPGGATLLAGLPGYQLLDSLAVDAEGWVSVATIINGGITSISPDGKKIEHTPLPDPLTTNVCFGGKDMRTAYATLSGTGKLVAYDSPRAGLRLNFNA